MSTAIHATVTIPHRSGFAEDAVVNTFNVLIDDDTFVDEYGEISIPIASFYNAVPTGAFYSLSQLLSAGLSRTASSSIIRLYDVTDDLTGTPHGSPVFEDSMTLNAAFNNDGLPEEVALCLTLRAGGWADQQVERPDGGDAGLEVDRPRQRYSGRIYAGPFNTAAVAFGGDFKARPVSGLITTLVNAAADLNTALQVNSHRLSVWSRKDGVFRPLDGPGFDPGAVQVDNAFDTQRRRGPAPTVRTTITV